MTETHLMVLWSRAREQEKRILDDLARQVRIRRCFEIAWSKDAVRRNYMRFYGAKLPAVDQKVADCGTDPFLLVVMDVESPEYRLVCTSRGHEQANVTVFSLKSRYREWTAGAGHRVHATNSPEEFDHDLTMLLGIGADEFDRQYPGDWDGCVRRLDRDVLGEGGWRDAEELSRALRIAPRHVVLRGIAPSGKIDAIRMHGDIDLLTDAAEELAAFLGGELKREPFEYKGCRVHNPVRGKVVVRVGDDALLFDLFDVRLGYYDRLWAEDMLAHRAWRGGFWRLDARDARFELLYHVLFHKSGMSAEYLSLLGEKGPFDYAAHLDELRRFLAAAGYGTPVPKDATIRFNGHLLEAPFVARRLAERFALRDMRQIQFKQSAGRGGLLYFEATGPSGRTFVKTCRQAPGKENAGTEYASMKKAWKADARHFPRPLMFCNFPGLSAICMEFVEGRTLEDFLQDRKSVDERGARVAKDLLALVDSLAEAGLVHRDFRPSNVIVAEDGTVKLIDFQFAVFADAYHEFDYYRKHPACLRHLGAEFARGHYHWDDAWSLCRVLDLFPQISDYADVRREAQRRIGRRSVRLPRKFVLRYKVKDALVKLIPFSRLRQKVRRDLRGC